MAYIAFPHLLSTFNWQLPGSLFLILISFSISNTVFFILFLYIGPDVITTSPSYTSSFWVGSGIPAFQCSWSVSAGPHRVFAFEGSRSSQVTTAVAYTTLCSPGKRIGHSSLFSHLLFLSLFLSASVRQEHMLSVLYDMTVPAI